MKKTIKPINKNQKQMSQLICLGIGVAFIFFGLIGLMNSEIAGAHFSLLMNLLHFVSGGLAFASGYSKNQIHSYGFCLIGFVMMLSLGVSGFIWGKPGMPGIGFDGEDPFLLVLIPKVLELGVVDHVINLILMVCFFIGAYSYWKNTRSIVT